MNRSQRLVVTAVAAGGAAMTVAAVALAPTASSLAGGLLSGPNSEAYSQLDAQRFSNQDDGTTGDLQTGPGGQAGSRPQDRHSFTLPDQQGSAPRDQYGYSAPDQQSAPQSHGRTGASGSGSATGSSSSDRDSDDDGASHDRGLSDD